MALIDDVKNAMWITVDDYDDDLERLIESAQLDIGFAGVEIQEDIDAIVTTAIITYCQLHFSPFATQASGWDLLKRSYDEQKAQLSMRTGYTDWGDDDDD